MSTLSFYARGDSSTANNAALNASGTAKTPTTLITFTSGTNGDLHLDPNGGLADPDTWVTIGGKTMTFTFQFSGYLPQSNKLANVGGLDLRGSKIAVITAANGQRFFFLIDGKGSLSVMNAFPNGAHSLTGVTSTAPVYMCFAAGTMIETTEGPREVERLQAGDRIVTGDGRALPLLWSGCRSFSATDLMLWPDLRPVVIPAHLFGPDLPRRALTLSPCHRIALAGWKVELVAGEAQVLVPARHLVGQGAHVAGAQAISYHHLYLGEHAVILSENLPSESFQPGGACMSALDAGMRDELERMMPAAPSPDTAPTLRRHEAVALLSRVIRAEMPRAA